jgi:hypothetical protein
MWEMRSASTSCDHPPEVNELDRLTDDQLIDTYLTAIAHGLNQCFIMLLEREIMRRTFEREKELLCPA